MTRPLTRDSLVALLSQGRTEEALAWGRRGRELIPLRFPARSRVDFDHARSYEEASAKIEACSPYDRTILVPCGFLDCADRNGQAKEAIPVWRRCSLFLTASPAVNGLLVRA